MKNANDPTKHSTKRVKLSEERLIFMPAHHAADCNFLFWNV